MTSVGLRFNTDGYILSGSGKLTAPEISVTNQADTATVLTELTGTGGLTKFGEGVLVLDGTPNSYTGVTSVSTGTLRLGASGQIPDASRLNVARLAVFDMAGNSETVEGLAGLGTVLLGGGNLTLAITGDANAEFNGFLSGNGDVIIDSSGTGAQIFSTTAQTAADGAVKDYTGRTIVRNGTLRVAIDGVPTQTSEVLLEGGTLLLSSNGDEYLFGATANTVVQLAGGAIEQQPLESVTLLNRVDVSSASTLRSTADPIEPGLGGVKLAGPVSGAGALRVEGGGRVEIGAVTNTYSGTVTVAGSTLAVNGAMGSAPVVLESGGMLTGSGRVKSAGGAGIVSPGDGAGVLTLESVGVSSGLGFALEFGEWAAAGSPLASPTANDVLRVTGPAPFSGNLTMDNQVAIFLAVAELTAGTQAVGGIFLDGQAGLAALLANGEFAFFVLGDGNGTDAMLGEEGYYSLGAYLTASGLDLGVEWSVADVSWDFGSGTIDGEALMLNVVPEPSTWMLLLGGVAAVLWHVRRFRRRS